MLEDLDIDNMNFDLDPTKQTQEIVFSRKTSKRNQLGLMLTTNIVNLTTVHKHLGMMLDSKLSFDEHLKSELKKLVKLLVYFENSKVSSLEHLSNNLQIICQTSF